MWELASGIRKRATRNGRKGASVIGRLFGAPVCGARVHGDWTGNCAEYERIGGVTSQFQRGWVVFCHLLLLNGFAILMGDSLLLGVLSTTHANFQLLLRDLRDLTMPDRHLYLAPVFFFSFVVTLAMACADSSSVRFAHLSTAQGLSQNSVRCIYQDRYGFMWFGTEDGLNRYDGYQFTIFRPDPKDPSAISNQCISQIVESHDPSVIWIGTNRGGVNRLDLRTGKFTQFRHTPDDPNSIPNDRVETLCEDSRGTLWVGTPFGLSRLNRGASDFVNYRHIPGDQTSLPDDYITAILE
jgi:hypothetical protein